MSYFESFIPSAGEVWLVIRAFAFVLLILAVIVALLDRHKLFAKRHEALARVRPARFRRQRR